MKTHREIELRGPLNKKQLKKLLNYCSKYGEKIKETYQIVIFLDSEGLRNFGNINSPYRISLSIDNQDCLLKVKAGKLLRDKSRKEFHLNFQPNQLGNLLDFLDSLQFAKGHIRPAYRRDFKLKDFEISIKTQGFVEDHYELEVVNENLTNKEAEKLALGFLKNLGLRPWNKNEYKKFIESALLHKDAEPKTLEEIKSYITSHFNFLIS